MALSFPAAAAPVLHPDRIPRRGILLMAGGIALFAVLNGVVKAQMEIFPVNQVIFFRNSFALIPLWLLMRSTGGRGSGPPARPLAAGSLGVAFTLMLLFSFWSFTQMPLAEATAISFTQPLMVVLMAVCLGLERVTRADFAAVLFGLIGVWLMLGGSGVGGGSLPLPGLLAGLVAAALSAGCNHLQRQLSLTESTASIAFISLAVSALLVTPSLAFSWVTPSALEGLGLVAMGLASGLCQYVMVRAFYHASAASLSAIGYTRMIWALLIGWLWFGDWPGTGMLLGAAVVMGSALLVWRRG